MWDLKQLRCEVERCFGKGQLRRLNPCLRSVQDRRDFAQYHFGRARDAMREVVRDDSDPELVMTILGGRDKAPGDFTRARFEAHANTVACVQSMHAVADSFAHVVYFSLGMNLGHATEIKPKRVSIGTVAEKLMPGVVKQGLHQLLCDPGFVYLSALNNQGKHRSLVETGYSVDLTGGDPQHHGLRFSAFEYEGVAYPARWVRPTLVAEYHRHEVIFQSVGPALNSELLSRK